MRILLTSTRGAGHLQPLLPYAHALLRRGHEVLVAAPESVGVVLQKTGLPHAPFDHPGDDALEVIWARYRVLPKDEATIIAVREIFAGLNARAALPKLRETIRTWQPSLIVRDSVEMAAAVAAEEAGIPHARVAVHNGQVENKILLLVTEPVDVLRKVAGLSPDNGAALRAAPAFTAFPASLDGTIPVGTGREPFRVRSAVDNASPFTAQPDWAPKDGLPLVYITFGTIAGGSPKTRAVYRAALDAAASLPIRALLTTGPAMDSAALGPIPANVTVEQWVPQAAVFAYATAMLCHGGSGTMLGGVAAGIPMVIAPLFADQPDNARCIEDAGAGIAVLDPDAASLRAALERVLAEPEIRANVRRIAGEMASMPDMDAAIDEILKM